jgi:hypothetical protein
MKRVALYLGLIMVIMSVSSCKKGEQGDIGPQGDAGIKGAQGPKGDTGESDAVGILTSNWSDINGENWTKSTVLLNTYYTSVTWPKLTSEIASKGSVYVYFKKTSQENTATLLPFSAKDIGFEMYFTIGMSGSLPNVILFQKFTPSLSDFSASDAYSFRIVVVPANPGGKLAYVDWNNYEQVKIALGLKD